MRERAVSAARSILLFSIATNGYDRHFAALLEKQRAFATRCGADYWVARESPPWGISAGDSAWLKIPFIAEGLARGYDWVWYLDADCEVFDCPSPAGFFAHERESIFMCHDFSRRLNSAVIFARNTPEARRVFRRLHRSALRPAAFLPPEDRNLYENGHVIHYLKREPAVRVIDNRWNCSNYREVTDPFIVHHGGTPIRDAAARSRNRWAALREKVVSATTGFRLGRHLRHYVRHMPRPKA